MSAIADENGSPETIKVLFVLYPDFEALDVVGPLEVLSRAQHNTKDTATKAFECSFVGNAAAMKSAQGATLKADMDYEDATEDIEEYDVLVVPGGLTNEIIQSKAEPLALIKKWVDVQEKNPAKERTILAVSTGSLLLAEQGLLEGLAATTHPDYYTRLETLCQNASTRDLSERTDVMEERYVVNNARFDLGENPDENPYIVRKRPDGVAAGHARRKSIARKGSNAWKESRRRESIARRASMPLGGMRVITTGGVTAGLDASLYLVASLVSHESAEEVARVMQYTWIKGVTVDAIDV
ncbi:class I glutamine amidotransferase-like protein, partial [Mytilinidion resinicola]